MKNVKLLWLLWLFVVLPAVVLGHTTHKNAFVFGGSYLKNSRLCHQWTCISTKIGLTDSLPSKQTSEIIFRNALPEGPWQDVIGQVLENCYENRTRRFTNTCPGQALMHCVVDQMIDFCPIASTRKDDSCSPVTSLAGLKYMFGQSRYVNLEKNLPKERRPTWFLRNYFESKCCDLPVIFNTTMLEECGFTSFMNYVDHGPMYRPDVQVVAFQTSTRPSTTQKATTDAYAGSTSQRSPEYDFSGPPIDFSSDEPTDPLDCCEMTKFIDPSWRSECNFHLSFNGQDRLTIVGHSPTTTEAPTTESTSTTPEDIMLVPHPCNKETCVFSRMGIISDTGILDIDAYIKMLDNFTDNNLAWTKTKARVLTKCVAQPVRSYEAGCEINNMLACTLDVLTENCPYKRKPNSCKHGKHDVSCQISSSKYRPKNRREICLLPELIHRSHLQKCGLESLYKVEHIAAPPKRKKQSWSANRYTCKDSKEPTTCMMKKMGVLNKYSFMDYFKMKDRIRQFTAEQVEWAALQDIYLSALVNIPMYGEHCQSEKKLLNTLDAMLMTCPVSKRKNSIQCNKIFTDMTHTPPNNQNVTKKKLDDIMKHYHHVFFLPNQPETANLHQNFMQQKHSRTVKKPVYDFAFLNSKEAPPVRVISLKPEGTTRKPIHPLIVPPVYLRPEFGQINDGVFRSNPFLYAPYIRRTVPPPTTPYNEITSKSPDTETTSSTPRVLHSMLRFKDLNLHLSLLPFRPTTVPPSHNHWWTPSTSIPYYEATTESPEPNTTSPQPTEEQ